MASRKDSALSAIVRASNSTVDARAQKKLENLEDRKMFSTAKLEAGILWVHGENARANDINVSLDGNNVTATTADGATQSADVKLLLSIRIIAGDSNDIVQVDPGVTIPVYVQTGAGDDTVFTSSGNDTVKAGNGNDFIETGAGEDSVRAGNGRDSVNTGAGHDFVNAGSGNDIVRAGNGIDRVDAASGDDSIAGEGGEDRLDAGVGRDTLSGGDGADTLTGEAIDNLQSDDEDKISRVEYPSEVDELANDFTFTLINAVTNQPIPGFEAMKKNVTIDLAKLPTRKLNLRAATQSGKLANSVAFMLDGKRVRLESSAPFAFAGDVSGDYSIWTPKPGTYRITANAFAGPRGTGASGKAVVLVVKVIDTSTTGRGEPVSGGSGSNNNTDPDTGGNNNNPAAPTAAIEAISTSVEVGHAIHVNALDTKLKNGNSLTATYDWNFGDAAGDYNTLRGFNAAHVYSQPGDYMITLKVTDSAGNADTVTRKISVRESTRRVIHVASNGSDRNNGQSQDAAVKTWNRARELVSDNTEIRFRAGDTFSATATMIIRESNVLLTSYGQGDKPIIRWTGRGKFAGIVEMKKGSRDVTIRGLELDSKYGGTDQDNVPVAIRPAGTNFAAIDCRIGNISHFINAEMKPIGVLAQGNVSPTATGLRAYLSYVVGTDHVYLGNKVANSTREHVIRSDGGVRVLIAHNDFTNIARNADKHDIMKQTITIHWGSDVYLLGNKTSGGRVEIGPLGEGDGLQKVNINQRLNRVVVEGNRFQFGRYQRMEIDHGTSGVVIRNNTIRTSDGAGINIQAMGRYTSWPQYGGRTVKDVWITKDNDIQGTRWATIGAVNVNVANAA